MKRLVFAALLTPLAVAALPPDADAQSRGSVGGYSSGAAIGGGSYGGGIGNRSAITRTAPVTRSAPAVRSSPALPSNNPVTTPRYGMSGYYQNNIGTVPPGTRATTVRPR